MPVRAHQRRQDPGRHFIWARSGKRHTRPPAPPEIRKPARNGPVILRYIAIRPPAPFYGPLCFYRVFIPIARQTTPGGRQRPARGIKRRASSPARRDQAGRGQRDHGQRRPADAGTPARTTASRGIVAIVAGIVASHSRCDSR